MRDYQTKANVGGGADSIVSTKFGAGEFNSLATENENAVLRAGLTLAAANGSGEDTTQLAQSLFIHSVKSQQFQDGGSANAYELTPISGSSGVLLPGGYDELDGARIWFEPGAANTGPSTVNIGQTSGGLLGTKTLLTSGGSPLSGGELQTAVGVELLYSSTADGGSGGWLISDGAPASTTRRGVVELATDAEAQALSDATRAITPATLESAFKGANQLAMADGWQLLPGDFIIQFGSLVANASSVNTAVTFPLAFPNNVFQAVITGRNGVGGVFDYVVDNYTLSTLTVRQNDGATQIIDYIAIGN